MDAGDLRGRQGRLRPEGRRRASSSSTPCACARSASGARSSSSIERDDPMRRPASETGADGSRARLRSRPVRAAKRRRSIRIYFPRNTSRKLPTRCRARSSIRPIYATPLFPIPRSHRSARTSATRLASATMPGTPAGNTPAAQTASPISTAVTSTSWWRRPRSSAATPPTSRIPNWKRSASRNTNASEREKAAHRLSGAPLSGS